MYCIKEFVRDHLSQLNIGDEAKEIIEFIGADALSQNLASRGPAFSAFCDDELFAIAGINVMWKGVGEAWAMLGVNYKKHGFFIHRSVIRYLKKLQKELNLERIQAVVLKDHWAGIEWVTKLGFDYEGEMERYFRGKTYLRYAKIYNVER